MRRELSWITLAALVLCGAGAAIQFRSHADEPKAAAKPPYVHLVVFYMKEDAPKDQVEKMIADGHALLEKIPSVKSFWIGRPAEKGTPDLQMTDYDVSMLLLFEDADGLKEYLEHKLHLEFRGRHAKHASRVLVYDFLNQTK